MPYNPNHHDRRSMRLAGYDYTQCGWYFVTICTRDRLCLFGEIVEGRMRLNPWGQVADREWHRTAEVRDYVRLDAFVVLPNHVHGIIGIMDDSNDRCCRDMARHVPTARHVPAPPTKRQFAKPIARSLSTIVGAYKSAVTKRINRMCDATGGSVWQTRFYDRIIRNKREHAHIRRYIAENPARWHEDALYT